MPRYRVGNSYLSEEEYDRHVSCAWGFWIFIIFSSVSGLTAYWYTNYYFHLSHNVRFSIIFSFMLFSGVVGFLFRNVIRFLVGALLLFSIISFVVKLIYSNI